MRGLNSGATRETMLNKEALETQVPKREIVDGLPPLPSAVEGDREHGHDARCVSCLKVALPRRPRLEVRVFDDELTAGIFLATASRS